MSVSVSKETVIKDACILFDLIDLRLLNNFYEMDLIVITTPEVLSEIEDEEQLSVVTQFTKNGKLQIDRQGLFQIIAEIVEENHGLSFADASVLEVASRRKAVILSSDKGLRNESNRRGLVVRGLLWILEELYLQKIIGLDSLLETLKKYPEINVRAPKTEIQALIKKYT